MDDFTFGNDRLMVTVHAQGAEMRSLAHALLGEMLWPALPIWPQHAPNLFPIVGQLVGDTLRHAGASFPMGRHGFARRRRFEWIDRGPTGCTLELRDDDETRAIYPFAFVFAIAYSLAGDTLTVTYSVTNPGAQTLPASVGAHPAFRWPLAVGVAKTAHVIEFAQAEPAPIRRLADGLLKTETFPTPVVDRTLPLDDALFVDDAIIMDRLASSGVRYTAPGAPFIDVGWTGFEQLGLWSKPGADFVCIEPWYGYASPVDFDGDFSSKPGVMLLAPGERREFALRIAIGGASG